MKHVFFTIIFLSIISFSTLPVHSQTLDSLFDKIDNYFDAASYEQAVEYSEKALSKAEKDYGSKSSQYAIALDKRGRLYWIYGEYETAEKYYLQSLEIIKNNTGITNSVYATIMLNLAQLYSYMDNYNKSERTFIQAVEIRKQVFGDRHNNYAEALYRMASMYFDFNQFDKAEKTYIQALDVIKKISDYDYSLFAQILSELSNLYEEQNQFYKMPPLLNDLLQSTERTKGKEHPDYRFYLLWSAQIFFKMKLMDKAEPYILECLSIDIKDINNSFYYLSENDKLRMMDYYLQNASLYYSCALERIKDNDDMLKDITNFRLMTKGLVLYSTNGVRKRVFSTDDPSIASIYSELIEVRTELSKAYTKTIEEQQKADLNIKILEEKAEQLERNLSNLSEYFKSEKETYNVNWEDVRNSLNSDEAAIDFLNFEYFDSNTNDTVYCAIIIKKDFQTPIIIKLCNKQDIDKYIITEDENDIYIKNAVACKGLYELIWKPLEGYLENSKIVYISTSGILNRVSFHALATDDNTYLIDKYDIRYTGNLKDIITLAKNRKTGQGNNKASIFGGIKYDLDPSEMSDNANRFRNIQQDEAENKVSINEIIGNSEDRGRGWKYLKGTVAEAEKIYDLLRKNNYDVSMFAGGDGNEEAFRSLSGSNSPSIIHLATHGFFFPGPQKLQQDEKLVKNINNSRSAFKNDINPMFRSGIVLAGANNIWKNGKNIEGVEDGILTAYEVSGMNLLNTDLVILSACESGLGDVRGDEGVFGLQRSFKIAGAKNIIVSLWKVPDKETAELMELFYSNWIDKKMQLEEAFAEAQKSMRLKYIEPYYWAAFVLI
ncbi:MAG: CHAT domain-containing tetratricopeptide repeat protein [Ignavibacteria bacterium]